MRYRVVVELKAARVVTLDADSAEQALARAQRAAFPGRHRRDRVKSFVVTGYPKPSPRGRKPRPRVEVPAD